MKYKQTKYPYRTKLWFHWHGRVGHPLIHFDERTSRTYVMVRAVGGGTRRLFDYQQYLRREPAKHYRDCVRKKLRKYRRLKA